MKVQFSLRWLLVLLTVAALGFAALAISARRQAAAVARLRELDCWLDAEPVWPEWFWAPWGESYSQRIVGATVDCEESGQALEHLAQLGSLREVLISGAATPPDEHDAAIAKAQQALPGVTVTGLTLLFHPADPIE